MTLLVLHGLSPRGRGKRQPGARQPHDKRSIPAWAGETAEFKQVVTKRAVYPRVGGGNQAADSMRRVHSGLSPRGRGKRQFGGRGASSARSIPAWAGETFHDAVKPGLSSVYPRVGGGNTPIR